MLRASISLSDILLSFDNTLRIDYNLKDVREIRAESVRQLENIFHIKIDKSLYEIQAEGSFVSKEIDSLLQQITENLKSMALLLSISTFDKQYGENLKEVKYLGYPRVTLMTTLKYLQDEKLYERRDQFFESLIDGVNTVYMGTVKKLFIVMIILEKLGISEGVSVIANYIYLGGF